MSPIPASAPPDENPRIGTAHCRILRENGQPKDFVVLAVNGAFERLTGLQDAAGRRFSELIPERREEDHNRFDLYARVARTGVPEQFEAYIAAFRQWFSITAYRPAADEFVAVFALITERKKEEVELRTLAHAVEQSSASNRHHGHRGSPPIRQS